MERSSYSPALFILVAIVMITTISSIIVFAEDRLKWQFEAKWDPVNSSPAIGSDGTIYVGSEKGYLYAIDANGDEKWKFETKGAIWSSPAIDSNGTIYVGSDDGYLYAINPDRSEKWKFKTGGAVQSSPAVHPDGTVYVGSNDNYLYAINPDRSEKWKFKTGGAVQSSPAVGPDGTVYVGSKDGYLYAINANGNERWPPFKTGSDVFSSPAINSDGTVVYVGSKDGHLYAIDTQNGNEKWRYKTEGVVRSSPAIGSDGTVYVGSDDGHLYSIDTNGNMKWKFKTDDAVFSSPAVGSDGVVYVGSNDWYLYAIDANGNEKWKYKTLWMVYSAPAIGKDGTIYVSSSFFLYALSSESLCLSDDSPWPKFHHDNQNTGCSYDSQNTGSWSFKLAKHWAPIWYQDTAWNNEVGYKADYITNFDFDGDWNATNSWESLIERNYPLKAYIYYWVVETENFYFIGYADFHPIDWSLTGPGPAAPGLPAESKRGRNWEIGHLEHENDMEGCLLVVQKNGSEFGNLLYLITQAHGDLKPYDEDELTFISHSPCLYVEAKGHGVYGDSHGIYEDGKFKGGDGIIYLPYVNKPQEPEGKPIEQGELVSYELLPIDELWDRREDPRIFVEFGKFAAAGSWQWEGAKAPWGWDFRFFFYPADYDDINDKIFTIEPCPQYLYRSYYEPALVLTDFNPKEDGFKFPNFSEECFGILFPIDISECWDVFRDTFGKEQVEYDSGIPKPHAFIFFTENYLPFIGNEILGGGVCDGMSAASLLFFEHHLETIFFEHHPETTNQLNPTKELKHHIEVYQGYQLGLQIQIFRTTQSHKDPNILFNTIQDSLNKAPDQRYVINIYGKFDSKRAGHSVVPYEIQKESDNIYAVYVYDCNYPEQEGRKIIFNQNDHSWEYTFTKGVVWTGDNKKQDMMITPISKYHECPILPGSASEGAAALSYGSVVSVEGDAHILFSDESGRRLGYLDGEFVDEIDGAIAIIPLSGDTGVSYPESYFISNKANIKKMQITNVADGRYDFRQYIAGGLLQLKNVAAKEKVVDKIEVSDDGNRFDFSTTTDNKNYAFSIFKEQEDATYCYTIENSTISQGDKVSFQIEADSSAFSFQNIGVAKTYDLKVEQVGEQSKTFIATELSIGENETQTVEVQDWGQLESVPVNIQVDRGSDGSIDDVKVVQNIPRWDVNHDGVVDILDLVIVGSHFGESIIQLMDGNPDINGDGTVDISDLLLVGKHFSESTKASPAMTITP